MTKINARDWIFEVTTDDISGTPTWAEVGGITTFDLNNSENEESTDTTTFASAGNAESQAMQRGASCALEGFKEYTAPGEQDAGQVLCAELAALTGEDSLGGFRLRHVDDDEWIVWPQAWVSLGSNGGGNNDKTSWSATCTRSGAADTEAVV